ncbi:type II toxin-antitoxin system RelE/ParE family toxin [Stenotrophomonas sp. NLF4-10]|uniref:type II toxin-antitoxin system RelE family toxin n=1 Tax=Stenotrophomonas sp. NLF4-10 TaxID=2918754 RepID=UPI001EFC09F4|nr:type II toxin-antitoxin system RelE/ParE family toxin [Stenotrophomonas sp. NLF4-10]MCG8277830.1 type II toxin-antitoxin system RelE/ParE family toxin [Stenotrophomonas sp. NLF4-10]
MNSVLWTARAAKQLRKLDRKAQADIRDAISTKLPHFPNCSGTKALTQHACDYRLRVGNYRVLFNHDSHVEIVSIEEVKKRDEHTY